MGSVLSPAQWFSTDPKMGHRSVLGHMIAGKNNAKCSQQNKGIKGCKKQERKDWGYVASQIQTLYLSTFYLTFSLHSHHF